MTEPFDVARQSLYLLGLSIAAAGFAAEPFGINHTATATIGSQFASDRHSHAVFQEDLLYRPTPVEEVQANRDARHRQIAQLPRGHRLPAEFERQQAVMISYRDLASTCPGVLANVVRELRPHVSVVILVSDSGEHLDAIRLLKDFDVPAQGVQFAEVDYDTMWVRDYGPLVIGTSNGSLAIDSAYDPTRLFDERVPSEIARLLHISHIEMPLRIAGGNLLSNGRGLALTTIRLIEENGGTFEDESDIRTAIQRTMGVSELIVLEPLAGEATGHVDMFATFASPDTVIVAECDPAVDPENAAILNRNVEILQALPAPLRPLNVLRVPMPMLADQVYRSYTNVIYANGVVLVPCYPSLDEAWRQRVFDTFHQALPNWKVVGIDVEDLIPLAGALHCVSMNVSAIDSVPAFPTPRRPPVAETIPPALIDADPGNILLAN